MADTSLSEKKIGLLIWLSSNLWQSQLRKVLYLTESTIQLNQHKFPGRYPNDRNEAELKFEINDIFKDINETD